MHLNLIYEHYSELLRFIRRADLSFSLLKAGQVLNLVPWHNYISMSEKKTTNVMKFLTIKMGL